MNRWDPEAVRHHLAKVLASEQLEKAEASRKLLAYLAERALRDEAPKEVEIAIDVFGKDTSFNGAEDSLVRVHVRTLRQRLAEYYGGPGRDDQLRLVLPKGGYRLALESRPDSAAPAQVEIGRKPPAGWLRGVAGAAMALLCASLLANVWLWSRPAAEAPVDSGVRSSHVWGDLYASPRTLTIVLGDLFMFTQHDPQTGRTQTVRDSAINSSEQLRAFLASNPSLAAERGQRYTTLITKSVAVGMASILPIVQRPERRVEVRILDELQVEDVRNNDIIYIGPFVRLGPLAGHFLQQSRYRHDDETLTLTDTIARKSYAPTGDLADQRTDYGLFAKFPGPTGNRIMIFASVARNAGLLQIIRMLTSPQGVEAFDARLRSKFGTAPDAFETLLVVTGFRRIDLGAEIVEISALPASRSQLHATRH